MKPIKLYAAKEIAAQARTYNDHELTRLGWKIKGSRMVPDPLHGWDAPWYQVETADGYCAEARVGDNDVTTIHRELKAGREYLDRLDRS